MSVTLLCQWGGSVALAVLVKAPTPPGALDLALLCLPVVEHVSEVQLILKD